MGPKTRASAGNFYTISVEIFPMTKSYFNIILIMLEQTNPLTFILLYYKIAIRSTLNDKNLVNVNKEMNRIQNLKFNSII